MSQTNWKNLDWLKGIESTILDLRKFHATQKLYAAFDADGTLWPGYLGENFFKWHIKNCHKLNLPPDPWDYYRKKKNSGDPRPAYLWLAQINQGQQLSQVRNWAKSAFQAVQNEQSFAFQHTLISLLLQHKVEIFIVTASIKWAVEPGVIQYGLGFDQVIGVETLCENNIVTNKQKGVISYREGKVKALLERTGGIQPFLSCGNSMGDLELLESATHHQITVQSAPAGHELYATESELSAISKSRNWISISLIQ